MTVPDATGYITRTALSLANLNLFTPDPLGRADIPVYDFVQDGLSIGATVKRRQIAESQYVDQALQLPSSKAMIPCTLGFFVTGRDEGTLQSNVGALFTAVNGQGSWELHVSIGGTTAWAWTCWDAETTVGFPVSAWWGLWQPVSVSTLRAPIPVAGPV